MGAMFDVPAEGWPAFSPDTQLAFGTAAGTSLLSQHLACGPCTPGRTQVKARHCGSAAHA